MCDAQLRSISQDGVTALVSAIMNNNETVARALLENGASSSLKGRDGVFPLFAAVMVGSEAMVNLLLLKAVQVDDQFDTVRAYFNVTHAARLHGAPLCLSNWADEDCGDAPR